MKKISVLLASATLILATSVGFASTDHHAKVPLESIDHSGVSGFVQITQLPRGGSNLVINVEGLHPGASYATFYYESADCSAPADLIQSFIADGNGRALIHAKIDDDLEKVGSVSVRVGPTYGNLLACARIHP